MMRRSPRLLRYGAVALVCLVVVVGTGMLYRSPEAIQIPPATCPNDIYNTHSLVPALVHQNYFAPLPSPDEKFKKLNPNSHIGEFASPQAFRWQLSPFEYRFYSEGAARRLLPSLQERLPKDTRFKAEDYIRTWDSLPRSILRADFWRYIVLYLYGGIYTDLDVELESPLPWQVLCDDTAWPRETEEVNQLRTRDGTVDGWVGGGGQLQTKLFVGIEDSHNSSGDHAVGRDVQLLTWTIAAAPAHPALLHVMEHIVSESPRFIERYAQENGRVESIIMDWTGPGVWTDMVFQWVNAQQEKQEGDDSTVQDALQSLPNPKKLHDTLFLPRMAWGVIPEMNGKPSDGVLVRHGYEGSWKPRGA